MSKRNPWGNAGGKSKKRASKSKVESKGSSSKKKRKKVEGKMVSQEKNLHELEKPSPLSDIDFDPFSELPEIDEDGINAGFYGTWGTGKTSCGLDFPGPVYVIDTEGGSAKVASKKQKAKGLKTFPLLHDSKKMVEATGSIMMRNIKKELVINTDVFFARYGIATSFVIDKIREDPGSIRTVIIDDKGHVYKMGQEWRTDAYGYFESPEKVEQLYMQRGLQQVGEGWDNSRSWTVAVAKILNPIRLLKAQPVNLVIISKTKLKSKTIGDDTIEWEEPNWHYEVPGLMDMVFHFKKGKPFTVIPYKVRKKGQFDRYGDTITNKPLKDGTFSFNYKAIQEIVDGKP